MYVGYVTELLIPATQQHPFVYQSDCIWSWKTHVKLCTGLEWFHHCSRDEGYIILLLIIRCWIPVNCDWISQQCQWQRTPADTVVNRCAELFIFNVAVLSDADSPFGSRCCSRKVAKLWQCQELSHGVIDTLHGTTCTVHTSERVPLQLYDILYRYSFQITQKCNVQ